MKKIFNYLSRAVLLIIFITGFLFITPSKSNAQTCTYNSQCINNQSCLCRRTFFPPGKECFLTTSPCGSAIIGEVAPPQGVAAYNEEAGGEIGLFKFASQIISLATIVGGIIVMVTFVSAGFTYVTSAGNASAHEKVRDKITWGLVGLAIIAAFYTIAGLIGVLFYGNAAAILSPTLGGSI